MSNSLCHNQSRCDHETDTCVFCELGSQGCAPDRGVCNAGLVYAVGRCLPRNEVPPDAPRCYTRCNNDVVLATSTLDCDANGFIAGCMPGLECSDGSCVPTGEARTHCENDHECPEFQSCMSDQRCYSNCDVTSDCPSGLACHLHVCRMPCEQSGTATQTCPDETECDSEDGLSGFCMPTAPGSIALETPSNVTAQFDVSPTAATLSAMSPSADITLSHSSVLRERLEVRRIRHRAFDRRGERVDDSRADSASPDFDPLWFVTVSASGSAPVTGGGFAIDVPASCGSACPQIHVALSETLPGTWSRWEGELEIRHASMGAQTVQLSFQASVDGRWAGTMYYFASFPDQNLAAWRASDKMDASAVRNGLIRQWTAFRNGRLQGGPAALEAILDATSVGSWQWPSIASACSSSSTVACYPYDDGTVGSKMRTYVSDLVDAPIPTGATGYPFAMNLEVDPAPSNGVFGLRGAIDSSVALNYPGNPAVALTFGSRPETSSCAPNTGCAAFLSSLDARTSIGGRALAPTNHVCAPGFSLVRIPWLVPGFTAGTSGGFREECRENRVPFAAAASLNTNLSAGNPITDGNAIHREISLVDGAMIDQAHLVIIFEEKFATTLRATPISAYGYMLLERSAHSVADEEIATSTVATGPVTLTPAQQRASCVAVSQRLEQMNSTLPIDPMARATLLLTGAPPTANVLSSGVHYLCTDTGLFDGGPQNHGGPGDVKVPCPVESNVRYFVIPSLTQAQIAALACQQNGTCAAQLQSWINSTQPITPDPAWACTGGASYCSGDRFDLRAGKSFFAAGISVFPPLESAIEEAFRYKTRFQGTRGTSVGFVPLACNVNAHLTPYCYDAQAIEQVTERVDCLLATYTENAGTWRSPAMSATRDFLISSMSVHEEDQSGLLPTGDGFERLNAELLIMLGDDAMTRALSSRFDLAAVNTGSFVGAQFEPNGINLSGIAGFEMRQLYRATQYYERGSQRFLSVIAPVVFEAIAHGDVGTDGLVGQELVSTYLERLIGGSTKAATAWSHIAQRYQSLNRPDLARTVLGRAYVGTYLESLILSRLMLDIADASDATNRTQVVNILEQAQARYGIAMSNMREAYGEITEDGERFGFSPDFIPFPAIDEQDSRFANAFEAVLDLARRRTLAASTQEERAINSNRSFETDTAEFQSELVQIAVQHENRLASLCGTFRGRDGRVYPATTKYAFMSDRTTSMGDPCGLVGNGEIHERMAELGLTVGEMNEFARRRDHLIDRIDVEQQRVEDQCGRIFSLRDLQIGEMQNRRSLQTAIARMENEISAAQRMTANIGQMLGLAACTGLDCIAAAGKVATYTMVAAVAELVIVDNQEEIVDAQAEMLTSQIREFTAQLNSECVALQIDLIPAVVDITESIEQTTHDVIQSSHRLNLQLEQLHGMRLEARRVQQQQLDAEQLAINVEAARNDPNVRVYMNSAMINADRSFGVALEYAYRATRLLEYYTSQSYENAHDLYQIRMVSYGEFYLDRYLDELEGAYEDFRGEFRTRSQRAVRLSLMDDIMQIPLQDEAGRALGVGERTEIMRQRLLDPARLDANGRRTVEFRTSIDQFSPCTFGHQINYIETSILGGDLGDLNANLMLWQEGTGVIQRDDLGLNFHQLPPALIVATPHINRDTTFDPSIFRNSGMRDRPLVNTSWRLVLEQLSPQNRDIKVSEIDDIYVYIYYTDMTNPDACR